jgi:plasmid stabilization system protein ParE
MPQALDDVEAIRQYIERDSTHHADLVVQSLVEAVGRLEEFPRSGRVVPEFNRSDLREIVWGNYRVVYRLREAVVEVLTVYHSARILRLADNT